jgi:Na+-driven multidrug efflux pump
VLVTDFICAWVVTIPAALIVAFVCDAPPVIVFFTLKCDQFFKWIIAVIKTNRFKWIKNLTREQSAMSN